MMYYTVIFLLLLGGGNAFLFQTRDVSEDCGPQYEALKLAITNMNNFIGGEEGNKREFRDLTALFTTFGYDINSAEDVAAIACAATNIETFEDLRSQVVDEDVATYLEYHYGSVTYSVMMNAQMPGDPAIVAVYKPVYDILKEMGILDLPYDDPYQQYSDEQY